MQILISWSRIPSKSRFRSFVKILFWVENPLLWRGIRDGQNSCCTCHNTKGWKHICVLRKQVGNKLFTVHRIPLYLLCTSILISVVLHGEDALKLALGKNVRSVQLASKSTNLRPGTQKTFGRKNTGTVISSPEPPKETQLCTLLYKPAKTCAQSLFADSLAVPLSYRCSTRSKASVRKLCLLPIVLNDIRCPQGHASEVSKERFLEENDFSCSWPLSRQVLTTVSTKRPDIDA